MLEVPHQVNGETRFHLEATELDVASNLTLPFFVAESRKLELMFCVVDY